METCLTQDFVAITGGEIISDYGLAYAPDLCYAMIQSYNAAFTQIYVYRYDYAANTITKMATMVHPMPFISLANWVYAAANKVFISAVGTKIIIYDPVAEAFDVFDSGVGGMGRFVYVPSKGKVYGRMGTDGGGLTYVGYVDLDLRIVIQLGTLPPVGASKPDLWNYIYFAPTNCLYGCWETGLGASMAKFNLTTNIGDGSIIGSGIEGAEIALDTDRNLIIVSFGDVHEVDPVSETIVRTTPIAAGGNTSWMPVYVSSLKKVIGIGTDDFGDGDYVINSYNTQTYASALEKTDYGYYGIVNFKDGSFLSVAYDNDTNIYGVRRLCLT